MAATHFSGRLLLLSTSLLAGGGGLACGAPPQQTPTAERLLAPPPVSSSAGVAPSEAPSAAPGAPLGPPAAETPEAAVAQSASRVDVSRRLEERFSQIWRDNAWGVHESKSGPGSRLCETREVTRRIEGLLASYRVKSIVDAACGDFWWMRKVDLQGATYLGLDIVPELIAGNSAKWGVGRPELTFRHGDLTADPLPRADLIICRDVLVHLPLSRIQAALDNFRASGSTYLLSTTFPGHEENPEIEAGEWRPLNLAIAPFDLGPPLEVFLESDPETNHHVGDKSMGLWRLAPLAKAGRGAPAGPDL